MSSPRIVALIIGCLMLVPGLALLFGGGALGLAYAAGRNDSGYFQASISDLRTATDAITAQIPTLTTDARGSSWLIDALETDVRLRVTPTSSDAQTFIGIGPAAEVDAYLSGVPHDEIIGLTDGTPVLHTSSGASPAAPPADQSFWTATTSGAGPQRLSWSPAEGRWAVVIMNADGSAGLTVDATIEVKAGFLLPLALSLLVLGVLLTAGAVVLIVVGATGRRQDTQGSPALTVGVPGPGPAGSASADHPVVLAAHLDPGLSRWKWLVKWFLAIPHYVVLAFLWPAFIVVTIIAGFGILFTGRYPRALFDFTSGVLRWSWRVSYYASTGGIGTDQYPPFTLGSASAYPATLEIAYPHHLSPGLTLVKWWLLALPHYLIIGLLVTNWWGWTLGGERFAVGPVGSGGLLGLLLLIAAVILLFTAKYPQQLFDLIVGFNRWIYRVIAYAALMTDQYPPFRLDQGGTEPTAPPPLLPSGGPADPGAPAPVGTGATPSPGTSTTQSF